MKLSALRYETCASREPPASIGHAHREKLAMHSLLPRLDDGGAFLHQAAIIPSIDDNKSIYLKSGRVGTMTIVQRRIVLLLCAFFHRDILS